MFREALLNSGPRSGQSVYHTMLAIACVAMALGIFFPVYEYFTLYHGPERPYKFEGAGAPSTPRPAPPAPAAPGAGEKKEGSAAEGEGGEKPAPAETKEGGEAPAPAATEGGA